MLFPPESVSLLYPHSSPFFFVLYTRVREWRDIDVRSVDETSRSSTSSQPPAPLEHSMVTNQSKDLLISGVRKWGAGGESRAEGRPRRSKAQVIMTAASSALPPCLASSLSHWPYTSSPGLLLLSHSISPLPSHINTHLFTHKHAHTPSSCLSKLVTLTFTEIKPRTMAFSCSIIRLLRFQITSWSPPD